MPYKIYSMALWLIMPAVWWPASAMQERPDSLRNTLKVQRYQPGSEREVVDTQNAIAWSYRDTHPDSALYYANMALKMAKEHGFTDLEIQATNYVGVAYRNLSNFSKAFEKYLEALRLSEEHGNDEQRGYSLINLGNLYLYQTNFQGAISYFMQALDQAQSLADRRMVAYCFLNLGRSYMGTGAYGQAELYFRQAIDMRIEHDDTYGRLVAEIDLSEVYMLQGDLQHSESSLLDIAAELQQENNPRLLAVTYTHLSKIYLMTNQLSRAELYALKALAITKDVNSRYEERNVLETLSKLYAQWDDYKDAFENQVSYSELNQQLFSEENIRRIEQLKSQYEMEKQETENEFLRKQSELNSRIIDRQRVIILLSILGIGLMVLVVLVTVRAYLIYKRLSNKIREQRDEILSDKELIENQSERLARLDEAKSRFFVNVAHDLRSPLGLVISNLDLIKEDPLTKLSPGSVRNMDTAYKNCKRLLYLTDEISDLTRLEEGKMELNKEVIRVESYLEHLCTMFTGFAESKGIKLYCKNQAGPGALLLMDPFQFEKIFYNLVSNALRHTPRGGTICIESYSKGDSVSVHVVDTGEGISPENLPRIFDRFYQPSNGVSRFSTGLGVGLSLVKELVELHDGVIVAESTPGAGTRFRMDFPCLEESFAAIPSDNFAFSYAAERASVFEELDRHARVHVMAPKIKGSSETILVVDDHPEIRDYISQILEEDYQVIGAAHGLEALELLKNKEVDLIISDLMMPWMDGFELIEALKSSEEFCRIPVLVVSARISQADQEKVLYQGINDYLQKPFQRKELVLRINNLLKARKMYEETGKGSVPAWLANDQMDEMEKDILAKLERMVMERIGDESLSVFDLADALAASERQVYRLVKKLTGMTPFEYVSEVRLTYADQLMRKGKFKNASEAARSIGLKNVTAFSRRYEKRFGIKPSEVLRSED